jgi:dTDP-4-dehydrorhamnose reductase
MPYIALDITDKYNISEILMEIKPDIIIHCAAWNAVDQADEKTKVDYVRATNDIGTQSIAEVCAKLDCKMVYISTDYVFNGSGNEPWDADSKASRALNVYGQTKLEGEHAVSHILNKYFIVRTSWIYGGKNCFVQNIIDNKDIPIFMSSSDIATPTFLGDLSIVIEKMMQSDVYGTYNVVNSGAVKKSLWVKTILDYIGIKIDE